MKFLLFLVSSICLAYSESVLEICRCIVYLPGGFDHPIFWHDVSEPFPEKSTCSENNKDLCANTCFEYFRTNSNNYDLTKIPKTFDVSLGQHICDVIGKDVDDKLYLEGRWICSDESSRQISPIRPKIVCVNGKYVHN